MYLGSSWLPHRSNHSILTKEPFFKFNALKSRSLKLWQTNLNPMADKHGPIDVPRAWKDPKYRKSLTPEQQASLPPNPVGEIELLDEAELDEVSGGVLRGFGGRTGNTCAVCTL